MPSGIPIDLSGAFAQADLKKTILAFSMFISVFKTSIAFDSLCPALASFGGLLLVAYDNANIYNLSVCQVHYNINSYV